MTIFFVDIDGTISDATERIKRAGPEPSRENKEVYDAWVVLVNQNMEQDKPIPGMPELCYHLGGRLVYLTSREYRHADVTKKWLNDNGFPLGILRMRPNDNYEETHLFKASVIEEEKKLSGHKKVDVVVIDDDESGKLEQLCKERGHTFLKARSGGQR